MPGRFAETLDSCPRRTTGNFFHSCRLRRQPRHFFPGKNPDLGLGRAPMPGRWRGREAMPGRHQPAKPSQSPGSLLYVLYVLYGSHKASH